MSHRKLNLFNCILNQLTSLVLNGCVMDSSLVRRLSGSSFLLADLQKTSYLHKTIPKNAKPDFFYMILSM